MRYTGILRGLMVAMAIGVCGMATGQTHYVPHIWVGGHAGLTLSDVAFTPTVKSKMATGMIAGLSFRWVEERHVGIMAELNFSQRGWEEDFEGSALRYRRQLTYVSLPIMTHAFFGGRKWKGFLNVGPEIGYLVGESISSNFDYHNPEGVAGFPVSNRSVKQMGMEIKNRFDYGITAGAGVEMVVGGRHSLMLEARYYFGLGNLYGDSKRDVFSGSRNSTIVVGVGYLFRVK